MNKFFKCKLCLTKLRIAFIPEAAPKCPSCSGDMTLEIDGAKLDIKNYCSKCHKEYLAYTHDRCPECGGKFSNYSGNRDDTDKNNDKIITIQGPHGGI